MDEIVCATRGGEGSRAVQLAAIERAKEQGSPLLFLYVAAPSTLGDIDAPLQTAVNQELVWMGKALLFIAAQRALAANLNARTIVLEGNVRQVIATYLDEHDVSLLLLGAPRGSTANVFGDDQVEKFATMINESTGVAVEIIRPQSSGDSRYPAKSASQSHPRI